MTHRWSIWRRRRAASRRGLSCRDVVELVTAYLDGALDDDERARFDAHIAVCEHCTVYLEQLRDAIRVMGTLTPEDLSDDMERDLMAAFRGWRDGGR